MWWLTEIQMLQSFIETKKNITRKCLLVVRKYYLKFSYCLGRYLKA